MTAVMNHHEPEHLPERTGHKHRFDVRVTFAGQKLHTTESALLRTRVAYG